MGSEQSKTQQLEAQITRLHDSLVMRYGQLRKMRITRGTVNFLYKAVIAILVPFLIVHLIINRHAPIFETLKKLSRNELFIFCLASFFWCLFTFVYDWRTARTMEMIESERFQIKEVVKEYESHANINEVQKALKDAGQTDYDLSMFAISAQDFGAQTAVAPRNSIFVRIAEWVAGDGPDRCYALICPMCHTHNGLIDPAEMPKLQYRCPVCKHQVSATKLIRLKDARPKKVDLDNLTEKDMKASESDSSDDEPPPDME